VQDILSLSALEKRQRDSQKDFMPLDLQDVLVNAVRQCGPEADNAHISLRITASAALETSGDAQLLEQAVQNLISNAIKYSGSQKVELSLTRIDNDAIIAVQDYGVGIAPEHQPRIFERFYRVHKERSRKLGGTGLGLAIVKHIAALHGGKAELQSKPGQGCLFQIILPLTTIP